MTLVSESKNGPLTALMKQSKVSVTNGDLRVHRVTEHPTDSVIARNHLRERASQSQSKTHIPLLSPRSLSLSLSLKQQNPPPPSLLFPFRLRLRVLLLLPSSTSIDTAHRAKSSESLVGECTYGGTLLRTSLKDLPAHVSRAWESVVMAERENQHFGALRAEDSADSSYESASELESGSELDDDRVPESATLRESRRGELRGSGGGDGVEENGSELKTLTAGSPARFSQNNHSEGLPGHSTQREESEEQGVMSKQEVMAGIIGQALQPLAGNRLVSSVCPTSSSEISPSSVAQSVSSAPRIENSCLGKADLRNSSGQKPALTLAAVKASCADGYNWRKYGQKQVKSPQGSRSYFRCTYSECCAKKVEFCDQSGHVLETIYKNQHNHDPPKKVNNVRQSRIVKSAGPVVEHNAKEHSIRVLNGSNPSASSGESVRDTSMLYEGKSQDSCGFNGNPGTTTEKEEALGSEPKRRGKKNSLSHSSPVLKPGKKPKVVVHAAGDVGVSGDGYRWRKYGQKMVKGNPHPRNYYRCTSAGCPVRKHIETAVDNASAVTITYKGMHDHDMPVPKKGHGLPSGPLVAANSPASLCSSHNKKLHQSQTQKSPTQWSVDKEGDLTGEAMELGGEKAMESARTLLSIGFEIKPC
ncbi:probable WRKY transcription factor 32 [Punica granatum]|uniref:WRKY domain-containing protein n=2 Tax=Punica granatum TaxID=22663 RepID=A0A218VZ33_PUNGR|nr:probable WRKY transcription factor 32 [Punica granatum]OWM65824.1 hypothetical protein CDL15_Pgr015249 [Punica granatum]PKI52346.1 hypothetical protein CRG98_027272 [Punica granatum]